MARFIAVVFFLVVLAVGLSVSSLNSHPVDLNYFLGTLTLPMSVVVIATFALGALCAFILTLLFTVGMRWKVSRLSREVKARDQEITLLRNPPA
jgi:putative membrane protein